MSGWAGLLLRERANLKQCFESLPLKVSARSSCTSEVTCRGWRCRRGHIRGHALAGVKVDVAAADRTSEEGGAGRDDADHAICCWASTVLSTSEIKSRPLMAISMKKL